MALIMVILLVGENNEGGTAFVFQQQLKQELS